MKLVSMKRSKAEKKQEVTAYSPGDISHVDDYGYNTRVTLGPEECKRLGVEVDSPLLKPGTKVIIQAVGYIKSGNIEFGDKDGDSPRIEVQITDLGLEEEEGGRKERVKNAHLDSIGKVTKD